jgi:fatty acid desaturase
MNDTTSRQASEAFAADRQQARNEIASNCVTLESPAGKSRIETSGDRDRALHGDLRNRLAQAGCFRPAPWAYGIKIALVLAAGACGYLALLSDPEPAVRIALTVLIAFASVQAGFLAHDAGDGGITSNRPLARGLRHLLMNFVSAVSSSYFQYLHKLHHLTLQRGAGGLGAGAITVNPYEIRWLKKLVSWNGIVFVVATVCLRGLTFKLESLRYVLRNSRRTKLDRLLMALHAFFWLILPVLFIGALDTAINYALATLLAGPYIGTVLILNHEGMSAAKSQAHLPLMERITRSTRNLGRSHWSDFVFGGVNNHIEHHLFPQVPAMRLRQARAITCEFCRQHGIPYIETSFIRALVEAANHFRAVPAARLAAEALS